MDMGKNRQQHEELKQVKQPSLVNYFDISNKEVVGKKKKKTANVHAYRVHIKYKIPQNLRRLGLLNKARRIQQNHNIFQPLSLLKLYSLNTTSIHVEVIFLEGVF